VCVNPIAKGEMAKKKALKKDMDKDLKRSFGRRKRSNTMIIERKM
jgi:hypothetical protein